MSFFDQDLGVARISEDLIALLIDKGLISFNDFPEVARKKLIDRWAMRDEVGYVAELIPQVNGDPAG